MTYISWSIDFALYLWYYLMEKRHTLDIYSMWPSDWLQNISRSPWPVFHGSVILPYISYYLMGKWHTWDISSIWPDDWPQNIFGSLWPQSSRKVQDSRTKPANFHFVLQNILVCLTNVLWNLAKKIIFWQHNKSCKYFFCPAKDLSLSDSCPVSIKKFSRRLWPIWSSDFALYLYSTI